MSKSRGTGIDVVDAIDRWGADLLRLWAASVEPIDDVRFGPDVIEQVGRVYRNLRNRMRFMISNLDHLGADDVVAREAMGAFDRLACAVADAFAADVKAAYDAFQIHDAYLLIVDFESGMSSLDFDALKDPLYSRAAADPRRAARSRRCSTCCDAFSPCWRPYSRLRRKKPGKPSRPLCAVKRQASSTRRSTSGALAQARSRTTFGSGSSCGNFGRASQRLPARAISKRSSSSKRPPSIPTPCGPRRRSARGARGLAAAPRREPTDWYPGSRRHRRVRVAAR